MVFKTNCLNRIKPHELGKHLRRTFIDKLRVYVKSGDGGLGYKKIGGIGGDGGNVIIEAKKELTLKNVYEKNLAKRYIALNGQNSSKIKPFGEAGMDYVIQVPCGVAAVTDTGVQIGEVNNENERLIVARGGKGGNIMNKFIGDRGQAFSVNLDLKLIADVGLIGFPNAGKSTLLSLISRAQPKIANYAFTTLNPQLGTIEFDDKRSITVADLPGLIEGAHYNRGMGHKFLKHISRTKINLFIMDINGFQLNPKCELRSPFETAVFLNKELEMYDENLINKPSVLVVNKMDTENAAEKLENFLRLYENYESSIEQVEETWRPKTRVKFEHILDISAKTNKNVDKLCVMLRDILDQIDEKLRAKKMAKDEKATNDEKRDVEEKKVPTNKVNSIRHLI